jgi:hypothetical protein
MRRAIRASTIVAAVAALYALAGFVAVPRIVRSELTGYAAAHYHRRLSLGEIHFNPFTLRLDVSRISFPDADSSPMVGADALHITLGIASLWRRGASFREIILDRPFAHVIVRRDGNLNIADLQSPAAPRGSPTTKSKSMRLFIDQLAVRGGNVVYEDRSHATPFRTELEAIGFDLRNFRTVGADSNRYTLDFDMVHGAQFRGAGTLAVNPFVSRGMFTVTGLPVRTLWTYLRDQLHFEVSSGTIALNGTYTFAPAEPSSGTAIDLPDLTVSELGIRPLAASGDVIHLGGLHVRGTHVDLGRHSLSIGSIALTGGTLHAALEADGTINLAALMGNHPSSGSTSTTMAQPAAGAASTGWSLSVPDISTEGVKLILEDREVSPTATVTLDNVALRVRDFRRPGDTPLGISLAAAVGRGGKLALDGTYSLDSGAASARLALDRIDLTPLQPFLAERSALTLRSGQLSTKLDVRRSAEGDLSVTGTTQVANLRTVDDLLGRDFVKWKRVTLEGMAYRSRPDSLAIRRIVAVDPYARVIVTPQRKLSLFEVFGTAHGVRSAAQSAQANERIHSARAAPAPATAADTPAPSHPSLSITIHRVHVVDGSAHYTDLWIVPHFFLAIRGLDGDVVGLSSDPRSRATVDLSGKVDRYAPISISGRINPFSATRFTDMKMDFHGVQLTTANPYSTRFAGYKIEKGTMSADITYHLENGALSADPHFVIDQLELGEKVASPDATRLPLKFAVALLKDRHGVIDLNLPISGNMSDPSFRVGPIILKVVVNLITKAAISPFALLGKLVGGGEHLQDIDFAPGSAALDAAARKRLTAVAKALMDRPGLKLTVPSAYSPALDRPALAHEALEQSLLGIGPPAPARKRPAAENAPAPDIRDPETRLRRLVELYHARLGAKAPLPPAADSVLATQGRHEAQGRREAAAAASDSPLRAAIAALESTLLARTEVTNHDLERLARHRAAAIQNVLLDGTHLDPGRVFVLNTAAASAEGGEVRLKLGLE